MARVVVVEDDAKISAVMTAGLTARGHEVVTESTGLAGLSRIAAAQPSVLVLDLGLPDIDGFDLLRMIRSVSPVPVIVTTARDDDGWIVRTLDAGADDYVVKPFTVDQLDARIRAVLRRVEGSGDQDIAIGGLWLSPTARQVRVDGRPIELTRKEYDLLLYLCRHVGQVVTKRKLLAEIWDQSFGGSERTVDVHLSWLRRKLGESGARPRFLQSVRGVGIRLVPPDEAAPTG